MARRRKALAAPVLMAIVALPPQAAAATVSASCGGSGLFRTSGSAIDWQDHTHHGVLWHTWYFGRQAVSHNWHFDTGTQYATIEGPSLLSPKAVCPS